MSAEDDSRANDQPEDVGSLGAEALRLLGAVSGWAAQHSAVGQGAAEEVIRQAWDGTQGFARGLDEHVATGAAECTLCPICRTVHTVRALSPEVRTHLTAAATSLVSAAAALLATPVDESGASTAKSRSGSHGAPGVQHIALDSDADDSESDPSA